jgi:type I restriction enzyme R subunit
MFIDKSLQGVQCVQTLSRLNRRTRGKKDTFVLDFVNKVETIQESFQNFYQTTILSEETDPNLVYDILDRVRNYSLFTPQEVNDWITIFFQKKRDDSQLQPILSTVMKRWEELEKEKRDLSRSQISNYCKLYGYVSMINQFDNYELEKHYIFFEYLRKKFPVDGIQGLDVSDLIDLESLNLDIKGKLNISLEEKDTFLEPPTYGEGSGRNGKLPEGTEESSKKLFNDIVGDEEFQKVVLSNNTDSNKKDKIQKIYENKNIKTLDTNTKLYEFFEKKDFKEKMIRYFISNPSVLNQLR